MGQLSDAANKLEKLAPAFLNNIRKMVGLEKEGETQEMPDETQNGIALAENAKKEKNVIVEDYQLKNIKRLIKKSNK